MDHNAFLTKVQAKPRAVETLDVPAFWQSHQDYIVQAQRVIGTPFFYPIYRWKDLYSFSALALMVHKGSFRPNPDAVLDLTRPGNDISRPHPFIDQDIERIGAPPELTRTIRDRSEFVTKIATAMQQDATDVERLNPGKTNVILCGGRDSLNLLLLRWQNPTIVYSAAPNTPLVEAFVKDNGLNLDVYELRPDEDPDLLPREIAEAATLVDLENWKWGPHISQIATQLDHNAVFWKGQFADAFMTDYWRSYSYTRSTPIAMFKKAYRKAVKSLPPALLNPIDHFFLESFRQAIWQRGSVGQGAHMGVLRSITDCLWVSGYHGPNTSAVWTAGDYPYLTRTDLRPEIGETLLGRPVHYPETNPGPPPFNTRIGLRDIDHFKTALETFQIETIKP